MKWRTIIADRRRSHTLLLKLKLFLILGLKYTKLCINCVFMLRSVFFVFPVFLPKQSDNSTSFSMSNRLVNYALLKKFGLVDKQVAPEHLIV